MVNSYNMGAFPQNYPQQEFVPQYQNFGNPNQKKGPSTFGMMTLGALTGGGAGYYINRFPVKNGEVSDTFAKNVFDNHINNNMSSEGKKFFEQIKTIIKKIDNVKTPEEFKNLMKENKLIGEMNFNGIPMETVLSTVSAENLKNKKNALKKNLESLIEYNISNIKDAVKACWDGQNKKFVKPEGLDSKIFDVIKQTKSNNQWKKALKYGGITAGIMGALTIGYKMMTQKN